MNMTDLSEKTKVYVYGTLRPGSITGEWSHGTMYDMGTYPAVKLTGPDGPMFYHEYVLVDEDELRQFDVYEGYNPQNPEGSLYLRVPFKDGFIYEYNQPLSTHRRVMSGDWLIHRSQKAGSATQTFLKKAS